VRKAEFERLISSCNVVEAAKLVAGTGNVFEDLIRTWKVISELTLLRTLALGTDERTIFVTTSVTFSFASGFFSMVI
jgi:hypothetical protein